jgi:hypothetical protein
MLGAIAARHVRDHEREVGRFPAQRCWRATLIQRTRQLDSIVARALVVAKFFDSIGQKLTSPSPIAMSA